MVKPKKILLVEDNSDDALLTHRALQKTEISVLIDIAKDGAEAIEYLYHICYSSLTVPDLIILDLNLPKVDGFEVLKKIRSEIKTKAVPVIILTSSREKKDIRLAAEYGANSYIQKPVDFVKFKEVADLIGKYWLGVNESV